MKTEIDCDSKNKTCAPKPQVIKIKKIISHPLYDDKTKQHKHDIGLIRLSTSANFTTYVYPICLIKLMDFEPFEYWLSGWGATDADGKHFNNGLRSL